MNKLNVLDLFSGGGGMSYGFHAHPGFQIVGAVDAEVGKPSSGKGTLECNKTYAINMGIVPLKADLSKTAPKEIIDHIAATSGEKRVDVLISCAPCTGFSRTVRKSLVLDDERNSLVQRTAIFLKEFKPKILVMENVRELLEGKFTHHFDILSDELRVLGYSTVGEVHNLRRFGLSQRRHRACIVAVENGLSPLTLNDLWGNCRISDSATTVRRAISHLKPLKAGERDPDDPWHLSPCLNDASLERLRHIPADGGSWPDLLEVPNGSKYLIPSMKYQVDQGKVGPYRDVYGRLFWDQPAVTIKRECSHIGNGRYAHPEQHRLCTVREMALLQGFPKSYKFAASSLSNMYRHIGDAVPPVISYQIAHICHWIITGKRPSIEETLLDGCGLDPEDIIQCTPSAIELKQPKFDFTVAAGNA
jgi:DNA (cytosine-5)-methyltransferase 1